MPDGMSTCFDFIFNCLCNDYSELKKNNIANLVKKAKSKDDLAYFTH